MRAAVERMGLQFVVLTSVDRDDLPDGGAAHFAETIRAVRTLDPAPGIEVLTPDFLGRLESLATVRRGEARRLQPQRRDRAASLSRTSAAARGSSGRSGCCRPRRSLDPGLTTKSGFMLGLGEREEEVVELLDRLREARVDIVTIGQYLRPSRENLPVVEYVRPEVFERYRERGEALGFRHVFAGPFVRSSYRAEEALLAAAGPAPDTRAGRSARGLAGRPLAHARRGRGLGPSLRPGLSAVRTGCSCCRSRWCPGSSRSCARRAADAALLSGVAFGLAYWCALDPVDRLTS